VDLLSTLATLAPDHDTYPPRLRALASPPSSLTVEGGALVAPCAVAIVGARDCSPDAAAFTFELAAAVARAGAVVVSGGATGVDAAAHRGALAAGGRTWAVCATGRGVCFPKEHADLYAEIARGPGAVVWPFPAGSAALTMNFLYRNSVLVALADAVVIVEAGIPSGTFSTASQARKQGRPLWAVAGPPWDPRFAGCRRALDKGARLVTSARGLLGALGLSAGDAASDAEQSLLALPGLSLAASLAPPLPPLPAHLGAAERALAQACSAQARHIDEIASDARVCTRDAATGLLTLALENVVVEGPEGFFRRAK
jgi:DNA processing protein